MSKKSKLKRSYKEDVDNGFGECWSEMRFCDSGDWYEVDAVDCALESFVLNARRRAGDKDADYIISVEEMEEFLGRFGISLKEIG